MLSVAYIRWFVIGCYGLSMLMSKDRADFHQTQQCMTQLLILLGLFEIESLLKKRK